MFKIISLMAAVGAALPSPSESYNPSGQSPAPAPAPEPAPKTGYPSVDNGVSQYVSDDCGKPVADILAGAATALTDACDKYGGLSHVKGAIQGLLASIPYSYCSLSCIGMHSQRDDKDAVSVLVGHSHKVCGSDYVGAGRTGSYLCVISCDFNGDYQPVAPPKSDDKTYEPTPAPKPEEPYQPSKPEPQPKPQPKPSPPASGDYGGNWEDQCIAKTNDYRRSAGLPALGKSGKATNICHTQANCMARTKNLSHDACGGLGTRLSQGGAGGGAGAENIAWNVLDAIRVVEKWWASPGHHKNIVNPKVTDMGCCITGEYSAQVFIQEGNDYGYGY